MARRTRSLSRAEESRLTRLRQDLRRLVTEIQESIGPDALEAGAEILADAMRDEAPVRTGFLRDRIEVVRGREQDGSVVYHVQIGERDFVGKTYYAGMVLYGTVNMPPNRFDLRAMDRVRGQVIDTVRAGILAGVS